jgi:DNA-binding NtrC family response regulator
LGQNAALGGSHHFRRAQRVCIAVQNSLALQETSEGWRRQSVTSVDDHRDDTTAAGVLHSISTLLAEATRPEIVACEISQVLVESGVAHSATAVRRTRDGQAELIVPNSYDLRNRPDNPSGLKRTFEISNTASGSIEVVAQLTRTAESIASVHAVQILLSTVRKLQQQQLEIEGRANLWPADELSPQRGSAVASGYMREVMTLGRRVARTNVTVLIAGESGTGKEILARAIHEFSDRADKPFIPVNCASIPRELLESQLFGHRRGAFTGADRDHAGFIRAAKDGTLFLDEIGELGLDLQPKLLRFLESGEISPLGDPAPQHVNVRIVAATNKNLEALVREGRFREDLFYRLNVVRLAIRPLRERRDEIPGLVQHFVARAAEEFQKGHLDLAEETMERLLVYRWPGNVRQLQNELRRMVALAEPNAVLGPELISDDILDAMPVLRPPTANGEIAVSLTEKLPAAVARVEREMIKTALREHGGRMDAAAKALGISRKGLYLKRQRLGL